MSDFTLFLGKFLKQGTAIASLAPSSPWLSRTTVRNIDWERAGVIVELGAGTGPDHAGAGRAGRGPGCRVVVLERDPDFSRLLRERFDGRPDFDVIEGDVRDLAGILADRGIGQADSHRLRPARPLVPQGAPAQPLPRRGAGAQARGHLQPDHRAALGVPGLLPQVFRGRPVRLRAPQPAPRRRLFLPGRQAGLLSPDERNPPFAIESLARDTAQRFPGRRPSRGPPRCAAWSMPGSICMPGFARRRSRISTRSRPRSRVLRSLVRKARSTRFGRDHGFDRIRSVADFQSAVPLRTYEALWNDYLRERYPVFEDLTWPGRIPFLALTSGTTQGATKYIPVSREMVASNRKAAQTMVAFHMAARPASRLFHGRLFFLGGTTDLEQPAPGSTRGTSAVSPRSSSRRS